MEHRTLVDAVAEKLLEEIVAGRLAPGDALPAEADIAAESQVSRLTVREALTMLRAINVISVQRGRGTFINPPDEWTSVEAIVRAAAHSTGDSLASRQLLEARRLVESGAAALAAARRTEQDLELLRREMESMAAADAAGDADAFVEADRLFHTGILKASGNTLFAAVFVPMGRVLASARREAFTAPAVRARTLAMHRKVLTAVGSGDQHGARQAMEDHMGQIQDDFDGGTAGLTVPSAEGVPAAEAQKAAVV
ncbi:FadR family transcriptional regulator [Arthrobacter sp. CAU 1506]|uniref:FadR/GntR family transcriptional regulator n=1 Tax=Arthrobacter sp. CAU 1506 TaxID=2560052 RepID=UPI0010AC3A00|nr:FadR/GntR family transcriptional regulator [Arthrobacter sp. CAU 1506]TJY71581.1 FadR family transcriptional regulator [Arthrobacter sp. CAU 1506]